MLALRRLDQIYVTLWHWLRVRLQLHSRTAHNRRCSDFFWVHVQLEHSVTYTQSLHWVASIVQWAATCAVCAVVKRCGSAVTFVYTLSLAVMAHIWESRDLSTAHMRSKLHHNDAHLQTLLASCCFRYMRCAVQLACFNVTYAVMQPAIKHCGHKLTCAMALKARESYCVYHCRALSVGARHILAIDNLVNCWKHMYEWLVSRERCTGTHAIYSSTHTACLELTRKFALSATRCTCYLTHSLGSMHILSSNSKVPLAMC